MTHINPNRGDYQRFFKRRREFNRGFVALVRRLMAETPDYTLARSILGGDFITAEEIMVALPDIVYSPEQIAELAATIPSEETLRSLKANGCGLMPQPPKALCLLGVWSVMDRKQQYWNSPPIFPKKDCLEGQEFAMKDLTGTGWLAIKKDPRRLFLGSDLDTQKSLLAETEYVPNVAEVSWFITIFYGVRGVRLFEKVSVRTSSFDFGGFRVIVDNSDAGGLSVGYDGDGGRINGLGLAVAWKL